MTTNVMERDWREENPGLHLLYVKWAIKHLSMVHRMIKELMGESSLNTYDAAMALQDWMDKTVRTDAAYADANEMLLSVVPAPVEDEDL